MTPGTQLLSAEPLDQAAGKLTRLFRPRGIAVVGASSNLDQINGQPIRSLTQFGYAGHVYPVNPKYDSIQGIKCYSTVSEVPSPCDLALIAVSALRVPSVIEQCGEAGIPFAIVLSAGFREAGEQGLQLQAELDRAIQRSGVQVVGPNCQGMLNLVDRIYCGFGSTFQKPDLKVGPVAMITQSGGFGYLVVARAEEEGIGFNYVISTGNEADLSTLDLIEHFLECADVKIIVCFTEGVTDGRRLLSLGRRALQIGKPILMWKVGNSSEGRKAAETHTARLTSDPALYRAVFRQAGIIEIGDIDDVIDFTRAFMVPRLPQGKNIAAISGSGGVGVLFADGCETGDVRWASFSERTLQQLKQIVPEYVRIANPLDLGAVSNEDVAVFNSVVDIILNDANVDLLMVRSVQGANSVQWARATQDLTARSSKPVLVLWGGRLDRAHESLKLLEAAGIPWHATPTRTAKAASTLIEFASRRRQNLPRPDDHAITIDLSFEVPADRSVLSEHESKQLLSRCGIPVTKEILLTLEEIVALQEAPLPFPICLKVNSSDIPHKTEIGGVRLGIADLNTLKAAARDMFLMVQRRHPSARIDGFLLQEMVVDGIEVIAGVVRDRIFGPTIAFGLGGVAAELMGDVTHRLAPIGLREATDMINEIRARDLFRGYRGRPELDVQALADTLARLSMLASAHSDRIEQIDINPLFVRRKGSGVVAADALVVLAPRSPQAKSGVG